APIKKGFFIITLLLNISEETSRGAQSSNSEAAGFERIPCCKPACRAFPALSVSVKAGDGPANMRWPGARHGVLATSSDDPAPEAGSGNVSCILPTDLDTEDCNDIPPLGRSAGPDRLLHIRF